ncbi:MAG TPA: hypothetical protein VMZ53_27440 [Kofleriaceae bacterium]|nr:hypothetical protein [Kofleriaceae bacterium]
MDAIATRLEQLATRAAVASVSTAAVSAVVVAAIAFVEQQLVVAGVVEQQLVAAIVVIVVIELIVVAPVVIIEQQLVAAVIAVEQLAFVVKRRLALGAPVERRRRALVFSLRWWRWTPALGASASGAWRERARVRYLRNSHLWRSRYITIATLTTSAITLPTDGCLNSS